MLAAFQRGAVVLTVALVSLLPASLFAAGIQPFTAKAFEAAQASGNPVLVEIHADWCPTCKAQEPILGKLTSQPEFSKFVRLRVDFDQQKSVVRGFKARYQSTLVLFKGKVEVGRSVGDTEEGSIKELLKKAV